MKTGISVFEVFHFFQYCLFVYASPGCKGGKEEIKSAEGEPGGPLVQRADLKSYCYSWKAGRSGWMKPSWMAWLGQSTWSTCVSFGFYSAATERSENLISCLLKSLSVLERAWEQGQAQSTWQRRQWVGMHDAASVAEIYTSCFKDKTIVFLAGLPSFRVALPSTQLTLRTVMYHTRSHCILVLLKM